MKLSRLEIFIRVMLISIAGIMVTIRINCGATDEFHIYPWPPLIIGLIVIYAAPLIVLIDLYIIFSSKSEKTGKLSLCFIFLILALARFFLDLVESDRRYKLSVGENDTLPKISGAGFDSRMTKAYGKLVTFYNNPESQAMRIADPKGWEERRQIDLFGFSRGAAEACAFANMVKELGIPDYSRPVRVQAEGYSRFYGPIKVDAISHYENVEDVNIRFMGIFDTVDARGFQIQNPDSKQLAIDTSFVKSTVHIIAAHEYRPGFDSSSALPFDGARIRGIEEYYSPGGHSDIGGSQPQTEPLDGKGARVRRDNLQDINLELMRFKATQAGIRFAQLESADRFTKDPRNYSEQELWNEEIHDSRLYPETYAIPETIRRWYRASTLTGNPFETYGRTERDIHYSNGSRVRKSAAELEILWRKQNGYEQVVKERAKGAGVKRE